VRRRWEDLVQVDGDAIGAVQSWSAAAPVEVTILEASPEAARRTLEALQVTTRSPLGAVAFHTGGILVDGGWLRILGSGAPRLPRSLDRWNVLEGGPRLPGALLVADDAIGGFYAWRGEPRTVHYLAPDTLRWEDSGLGYGDWLAWCFTSRLAEFYASLRWDGWRSEVERLGPDQGLHVYPPLVAEGPPLAERSRRAVPVEELLTFSLELQRQLAEMPEGATFEVKVEG